MYYLNLIRYKNLFIIALTQICIKYGLFVPLKINLALSDFQFSLLVLSTLFIAAAGNIINDIYDVKIDKINKPEKVIIGKKITEAKANKLYIFLNIIGVVLGFYIANSIGKPSFAAIFIIISALLYIYSSQLKGVLFFGNLIISLLVAMSLLIMVVFDILPAIEFTITSMQIAASKVVLQYAFFVFFINFIREIVKDLEDINGDKNGGLNTIPIAIGRKRATILVFILSVLVTFFVILYMYMFLYSVQIMVLYFLFLILAPLLYFCIKAWSAENKKDYYKLSIILKIILVMGLFSMLLYPLILNQ
jgi:4-hydroxybenzoate polyprenyltransferase